MLKQFKGLIPLAVGFCGYTFYKNRCQHNKKFTYDEVKKHNKENNAWIIHKNNVYDVSKFIDNHPGGKDKIMLAVGKSVDPFWNIYRQHLKQNVQDILTPMKIGTILDYKPATEIDPYTNDPIRDTNLKFHSYQPCNAETPVELIADYPITPSELWYIRNHHPVPQIDIDKHRLSIDSKYFDSIKLNINDLKKMKETTITATMQCGGNRRGDYNRVDKTSGTPWDIGAISTAKWTGVLLSDIIKSKHIERYKDIKHVQFESIDSLKASVPIEKLMKEEILIAYKMNDEDIPRDHGYPLRAIVPGHVGVRNVKWLSKIILSDEESEGPWQKSIAYKVLPMDVKDARKIDSSKIPTMQEMPIQSAITTIEKNDEKYIVEGYAYTGNGNEISEVEISNDDGITWNKTELNKALNKNQKHWAWTIWKSKKNISDNPCFICRAVDVNGNKQPSDISYKWNLRGLNNNTLHKKCYEK
jgi:sulfite oxidase